MSSSLAETLPFQGWEDVISNKIMPGEIIRGGQLPQLSLIRTDENGLILPIDKIAAMNALSDPRFPEKSKVSLFNFAVLTLSQEFSNGNLNKTALSKYIKDLILLDDSTDESGNNTFTRVRGGILEISERSEKDFTILVNSIPTHVMEQLGCFDYEFCRPVRYASYLRDRMYRLVTIDNKPIVKGKNDPPYKYEARLNIRDNKARAPYDQIVLLLDTAVERSDDYEEYDFLYNLTKALIDNSDNPDYILHTLQELTDDCIESAEALLDEIQRYMKESRNY